MAAYIVALLRTEEGSPEEFKWLDKVLHRVGTLHLDRTPNNQSELKKLALQTGFLPRLVAMIQRAQGKTAGAAFGILQNLCSLALPQIANEPGLLDILLRNTFHPTTFGQWVAMTSLVNLSSSEETDLIVFQFPGVVQRAVELGSSSLTPGQIKLACLQLLANLMVHHSIDLCVQPGLLQLLVHSALGGESISVYSLRVMSSESVNQPMIMRAPGLISILIRDVKARKKQVFSLLCNLARHPANKRGLYSQISSHLIPVAHDATLEPLMRAASFAVLALLAENENNREEMRALSSLVGPTLVLTQTRGVNLQVKEAALGMLSNVFRPNGV